MSQFVIILVVMMTFLSTGVIYTSRLIRNVKTEEVKTECNIIDRALETWATAHKGVDEDSVTYVDTGAFYAQQRLYPSDLGELQSRGFFPSKIDLAKFHYATHDKGTAYQLEVNLPDGTVYKSPQSSF